MTLLRTDIRTSAGVQCEPPEASPNGGSVAERRALHERLGDRLAVNPELTRRLVSYQGNKGAAGFRWLKYKEGFSRAFVERCLRETRAGSLLDPFAGIGTAPIIAAKSGLDALGIEISPVGVMAGNAIARSANGLSASAVRAAGEALIAHAESDSPPKPEHAFPHLRITQAAFPPATEAALARAREFLHDVEDGDVRATLDFACLSVLEDTSYTRKDGQYLRWDRRSGRQLRASMEKGDIPALGDALRTRLDEIARDIVELKAAYGACRPEFRTGSSLELLRDLDCASRDLVITSPPYANRYDYTRTYALELAWLGYGQAELSKLRQDMITATVENKPKWERLEALYGDAPLLPQVREMVDGQGALQEVLANLRAVESELSNRQVIRLVEGYFLELGVIIAELGRIVRSGGAVVMVNDNVRYHGEEVPVDLILSDFAEQCGFRCDRIEVLPRGKGNASQQMGRFGRREIRKCVYRWTKK